MLKMLLSKLFGFTKSGLMFFVLLALSVFGKYRINPSVISVRNCREEANFIYFKDFVSLFIISLFLSTNISIILNIL